MGGMDFGGGFSERKKERFFGVIWILSCWLLLLIHGFERAAEEVRELGALDKRTNYLQCLPLPPALDARNQRLHDSALGIPTNPGSSAKRYRVFSTHKMMFEVPCVSLSCMGYEFAK